MKRFLIAGNWKMNLSVAQGCVLAGEIVQAVGDVPSTLDVLVLPPFPHLYPVSSALDGSTIQLGAQTASECDDGARTGEVSVSMLAPVCSTVLVGHSERRHLIGESDQLIGKKAAKVLSAGLRCILAVGETEDDHAEGRAREVITRQLETGCAGIGKGITAELVIAYEPVWAIGTGRTPEPEQANERAAMIASWCADRFGSRGETIRVLYGGSMTRDNAVLFMEQSMIAGGLIGGASLDAQSFAAIIRAASTVGEAA